MSPARRPSWWQWLRESLTPTIWPRAALAAAAVLVLAIGVTRFIQPSDQLQQMRARSGERVDMVEITDRHARPCPPGARRAGRAPGRPGHAGALVGDVRRVDPHRARRRPPRVGGKADGDADSRTVMTGQRSSRGGPRAQKGDLTMQQSATGLSQVIGHQAGGCPGDEGRTDGALPPDPSVIFPRKGSKQPSPLPRGTYGGSAVSRPARLCGSRPSSSSRCSPLPPSAHDRPQRRSSAPATATTTRR